MENKQQTWYVTGASQGLGLELVNQLLAKGYNVSATARNLEKLQKAVNTDSPNFLPLEVDLLDEDSIKRSVAATVAKFGNIYALVNNAGYGLMGGIEESSKKEVQDNFDVNVFGLLSVTRAILPHMRAAKAGHIFNISSAFGLISGAGWGIYCATKFALEGLSEALAQEVQPFGIKVTIIEPGYFRTNFLNSGSVVGPEKPISEYTELAEGREKHKSEISGTQPGDPVKGVAVIINTAEMEEPPLRLLLGSDAVGYAKYKIGMLEESVRTNEAVSISTDFQN